MLPNTIHPGEILQDILSDRGITQSQLRAFIRTRLILGVKLCNFVWLVCPQKLPVARVQTTLRKYLG
jgi:hypothetical protein